MLYLIRILIGGLVPLAAAYGLGALVFRNRAVPRTVLLAVGTAIESSLIFLLLQSGAAAPGAFAALGLISVLPLAWIRPTSSNEAAVQPLGPFARRLFMLVFVAYGVLYFVQALAPEVEFDGFTYHLGLPAEYIRLRGFPDRIGFFELLPQGMEMLYTFAFLVGKHSAAKLCHFAYLAMTPPLMVVIARRLGLADVVAWAAACFYVCAPVVGIAGSSVHNDAPLVFLMLAVFYLLLRWHQEGDSRLLIPAGLAAGFCYAIKLPGLMVPALAAAFVFSRQRVRPAALVALAAALMIAPWMLRSTLLTGNPFAPLLNRWFPNEWFHISTEQDLVRRFHAYGGKSYWTLPLELTIGAGMEGIFGPLFLLSPLALAAVRKKAGRVLLAASVVMVVPWLLNHGARFLMPAAAFGSLALAMALPRPVLWAAVAFHAVACWPQVIPLYARPGTWQFKEFPWRAALRLESERDYLRRITPEFPAVELLELTGEQDRTFCLVGTPRAYITRDTLEFWHSAEADRLMDTLKVAGVYNRDPFFNLRAEWTPEPLRAVRFRLLRGYPAEWCVHEVELYSPGGRLGPRRQWVLDAWPNRWETPAGLDDNRATRWRTWEPMRRGMYFQIDFGRPLVLNRAVLLSHTPLYRVPVEFDGLGIDGHWRRLGEDTVGELRAGEDMRRPAIRALKRAGFRYLLVPTGADGAGPLGTAMVNHLTEWGLRDAGTRAGLHLLRVP